MESSKHHDGERATAPPLNARPLPGRRFSPREVPSRLGAKIATALAWGASVGALKVASIQVLGVGAVCLATALLLVFRRLLMLFLNPREGPRQGRAEAAGLDREGIPSIFRRSSRFGRICRRLEILLLLTFVAIPFFTLEVLLLSYLHLYIIMAQLLPPYG